MCPGGDPSEQTLSYWGGQVEQLISATSSHVVIHNLRGPTATRAAVDAAFQDSDILLYFGHGDWSQLGDPNVLVDQASAAPPTSIIVAIACRSSRDLGQALVDNGLRAYVGFADDLLWVTSLASQFGSAIVTGLSDYIRLSTSIGQAHESIRAELDRLLDFYKNGDGRKHRDAVLAWTFAYWDRMHVVGYGDPAAVI